MNRRTKIAVDYIHEASERVAIARYADFVDDHGHHKRVNVIESSRRMRHFSGRRWRELAHHTVLLEAREILDTVGRKTSTAGGSSL